MRPLPLVITLLLAAAAAPALAQTPAAAPAAKPGPTPPAPVAASLADQAFGQDMKRMDDSMMSAHATGNADRDFVLNMMPHHQGAIEMAQTELQYGTDPSLRTLSLAIIRAQRREFAFMKEWLAAHKTK